MLLRHLFVALFLSVAEVTMMLPKANAGNGNLTVMVDGFRNKNGQVCASLYSRSNGFPMQQNRADSIKCVRINKITSGIKFDNLTPGSYAVAIFHDANSDGKLNTGLFGIPSEGLGCSRNPKGGVGAPSFQDAAILVVGSSDVIQVQLRYL
jgi:uncharacterized protein (DUF2141 family)